QVTSRFAFAYRLTVPITTLRAMPGAHRVAGGFSPPAPTPHSMRVRTMRFTKPIWSRFGGNNVYSSTTL
ncbi:MAG: hypothetical protein ACFFCW_48205, partial [Candidatus Hodarchaeota archaeon]